MFDGFDVVNAFHVLPLGFHFNFKVIEVSLPLNSFLLLPFPWEFLILQGEDVLGDLTQRLISFVGGLLRFTSLREPLLGTLFDLLEDWL